MRRRSYGVIGMVGIGVAILTLLALHFLDTDVSPVDDYMSFYALGDFGWLMAGGNIAAGVGTIAIAFGLRETLAPASKVTLAWSLVLIGGLSFAVLTLLTTDPPGNAAQTMQGVVHNAAGYIQLLSFLVAAWLLRTVFARDEGFRHFARSERWFAILMTVSLLLVLVTFNGPIGLAQRLFAVVLFSWLLLLAQELRRTESSSHARTSEST